MNGQRTLLSNALTVALTALVTFVVLWFTVAANMVTREDVSVMIQKEAPYVEDRQQLANGVLKNAELVGVISERLRMMENKQVELNTKIDILLLGLVENGVRTQ